MASDLNTATDRDSLLTRFNKVLNNVETMINKEGPIYSVWIKFQLGDTNALIFDSTSTIKDRNLITSLQMTKGSDGMCNNFTLTVQYDPFNYGQETKNQLEQLDEFVAMALDPEFDSKEKNTFKGKIQYGYNYSGGDLLVRSPEYEFLLTGADSQIRFDSGLGTYTFTGVSYIGADCDFMPTFTAVEKWRPLDLVAWILFYYYGDNSHIPNGISTTDKCSDSALGYIIDIPQDLLDDQFDDDEHKISMPVINNKTPWQYCMSVLEANPLTKSEQLDGQYEDLSSVNPNERPYFTMYITENAGQKTIHVAHVTPRDESKNKRLNHSFSWGARNEKNLIVSWNPEVNLFLYVINKLSNKRLEDKFNGAGLSLDNEQDRAVIEEKFHDDYETVKRDINEIYNATLEIVGIPSDPPLLTEVEVIPKVLESVSRTAGIYVIKGCEDNISTNGTYTTTLKLLRIRDLYGNSGNVGKSKKVVGNGTTYGAGSMASSYNSANATNTAAQQNKKATRLIEAWENGEWKAPDWGTYLEELNNSGKSGGGGSMGGR